MIRLILSIILIFSYISCENLSSKLSKIWGPGLYPDKIVMPARYFFIETRNERNEKINLLMPDVFKTVIEGSTKEGKPCRIWTNTLERNDGSYIIRYKLFDKCINLKISVMHLDRHIDKSPYEIPGEILPDQCDCPKTSLDNLIKEWQCGEVPGQLTRDFRSLHDDIDWDILREEIIENMIDLIR
ncbi:hypothetical protein HHI36_006718 [Cryptolaemus montrouzieri]|uniref:Uncharacterized protein n=1 Tax=Cryptolaemus montrouzieri TaxID=559131 RepID=A0ABD2NXX7_9CUCU